MHFKLTAHAESEIVRRKIPDHLLEVLLQSPQQVVSTYGGRKIYQSQVDLENTVYLLRAVVDDRVQPPTVVTVYRTSKILKYWRVT